VKWLRIFSWEAGAFPEVRLHNLFGVCYHCGNPACVRACPNGAVYKEEKYGAVLLNPELCKGARKCWVACPYGAPQFADENPGAKMSKCTMCIERLENGQQPVCTLACPTRALDFGAFEEITRKYGNVHTLPGMPNPRRVRPSVVFLPRAEHKHVVPYDSARALELICKRGSLSPSPYGLEVRTNIPSGLVKRDRLAMKARSGRELIEATRSE
jgi:anaerobic dimethyl sulfoxide reductase subunit B (iron-sulfur subunit)